LECTVLGVCRHKCSRIRVASIGCALVQIRIGKRTLMSSASSGWDQLTKALAVLSNTLPGRDPVLLSALAEAGSVTAGADRFSEAKTYFERVVSAAGECPSAAMVTALQGLAAILVREGDSARADALLQQAKKFDLPVPRLRLPSLPSASVDLGGVSAAAGPAGGGSGALSPPRRGALDTSRGSELLRPSPRDASARSPRGSIVSVTSLSPRESAPAVPAALATVVRSEVRKSMDFGRDKSYGTLSRSRCDGST
jgi:hypothetical protein